MKLDHYSLPWLNCQKCWVCLLLKWNEKASHKVLRLVAGYATSFLYLAMILQKERSHNYLFSEMNLIPKDKTILWVREKYISPALEVYSMELETGLATSPGTPGDDDDITNLGDY